MAPPIDIQIAREKVRSGDCDGGVELSRSVVNRMFEWGGSIWIALATSVLAETLLQRGGDEDFDEAQSAVDRLAAVPTDPGFVLNEVYVRRLRALLARARGAHAEYRDYRDRYRDIATSLGFEGHVKWAEEMP